MTLLLAILLPVLPFLIATIVSIASHQVDTNKHKIKPEKITTGRFKGKFLMLPYDVLKIEEEVFGKPVEAMIAEINSKDCFLGPRGGPTLTESTIARLDEELNPWCDCVYKESLGYDKHRVSEHKNFLENFCLRMKIKHQFEDNDFYVMSQVEPITPRKYND